jgi:hypothetical protein
MSGASALPVSPTGARLIDTIQAPNCGCLENSQNHV